MLATRARPRCRGAPAKISTAAHAHDCAACMQLHAALCPDQGTHAEPMDPVLATHAPEVGLLQQRSCVGTNARPPLAVTAATFPVQACAHHRSFVFQDVSLLFRGSHTQQRVINSGHMHSFGMLLQLPHPSQRVALCWLL